jgi:hypothetical protein
MDEWLIVEESKWRWDAVGSEARTRKIIKWQYQTTGMIWDKFLGQSCETNIDNLICTCSRSVTWHEIAGNAARLQGPHY